MPDMDGFQTAELIRSRKRSRETPILFLTAYRSDEQLFRGYDLGAVDFLFKPIVPEVLQSKVSVFVELSRSAQLMRRQAAALARTEQKFRAVHQNGTAFPVEITRSPFESSEGLLVTTAIRDATEQVEAEERIRRINTELERRVAERTVELTRSNEALRQFAWAASHDLQEPIRTVLSYSQWLSQSVTDELDEKQQIMLRFIEQHASRMHQLAGGLQQYIVASEAGQQAWTAVDCNVVL